MSVYSRYDRPCAGCGATFTPARRGNHYCGDKCRAKAWREKKHRDAATAAVSAVHRLTMRQGEAGVAHVLERIFTTSELKAIAYHAERALARDVPLVEGERELPLG